MKIKNILFPSLALGAAALLLLPAEESFGYTTNGGSLTASSQRNATMQLAVRRCPAVSAAVTITVRRGRAARCSTRWRD